MTSINSLIRLRIPKDIQTKWICASKQKKRRESIIGVNWIQRVFANTVHAQKGNKTIGGRYATQRHPKIETSSNDSRLIEQQQIIRRPNLRYTVIARERICCSALHLFSYMSLDWPAYGGIRLPDQLRIVNVSISNADPSSHFTVRIALLADLELQDHSTKAQAWSMNYFGLL